jgi:hypothetical protein
LKAEYARRNLQLDEVNIWDLEKPLIVDALYVLDNKMIYASIQSKLSIVSISLEHDGVGVRGKEELLLRFEVDWITVNSICVNGTKLFVAHTKGIDVGKTIPNCRNAVRRSIFHQHYCCIQRWNNFY